MDASFWHRCWENNTIGFHQETVHPFLIEHLAQRIKTTDKRVFVPLCGKTLDMYWLAEKLDVVGAELSDVACRDFFADQQIVPQQDKVGKFTRFHVKNIELWQGDFFHLAAEQFPQFDWIYDRAAIIALPVSLQKQYVEHLTRFLGTSTQLMLISLEFPEHELSGPPFPVFRQDIEHLFDGFDIQCIGQRELPNKQFAQRTFNVSYLTERVYIIQQKVV